MLEATDGSAEAVRVCGGTTKSWFSSWDAGSLGEALALGGVLDSVFLQSRQVDKSLAAPHALELGLA